MVERWQPLLELHELFSFLCNEVSLAVLLVSILPHGLPVHFEHFNGHFSCDTLAAALIAPIILYCLIVGKDFRYVDGLHLLISRL